MAGLPTVQVLLDDSTGTFPYDISAYAQLVPGYKAKRGRQDELSSVTPGELSLVLDNTDGRFTLGSTVIATPSPIQVDQKIRIKITANATVFTRATAYVQSWPVEWPTGGDELAFAAITAVDVQAKGERQPLRSIIEQEILEDSPAAYYTLGEPSGATTAADSSGNQASALSMYAPGGPSSPDVVFGTATGPAFDGLTAATFPTTGKELVSWSVVNATVPAFECAFLTTSNGIMISASNPNISTMRISTNGANQVTATGAFGSMSAAVTVNDGGWHVAGLRYSGTNAELWVDGVVVASTPSVLTGEFVGTVTIGASGTADMSMAHVALFTTDPGSTRFAAHASAMLTGLAGEAGTTRITRLAGYANLPVGTLDTSLTNVAYEDITGKSVIEAIRDVADAEMGLAFVDGSGNVIFHNRNRAVSKLAPDVTIDANFLAEGTQFIVDMQGVINYYETTAAGTKLTQVARDTVSENGDGTAAHPKHGRYPQSKTYLVQTDAEALDRANWIVSTHSQPAPRVGSLVVDVLTMTAAQQAAMAGLEPNSWLRVTGLPGQTPGSTTADFIVQGWAESLNAGEWTLTLNAANKAVAAPTPWILGDTTYSVLGSTTRLYV